MLNSPPIISNNLLSISKFMLKFCQIMMFTESKYKVKSIYVIKD